MALILSIETASKACSVALHDKGILKHTVISFEERSAAERLTLLIEKLIKESDYKLADLKAIAVSMGPGSYTGLRIGVSTAKGLCFGLNIPLIAINSLDAIIEKSKNDFNGYVCAMLDARRMEVYTKVVNTEGMLEILPVHAEIIEEHSFKGILAEKAVYFCGEGFLKCKQVLENSPNSLFAEKEEGPVAEYVGILAYKKYMEKQFENLPDFEPFYLKEFLASTPKMKKVTT